MIDITDEFAAALDIIASGRHLFVIGGPRSGKSTFATHLQHCLGGNVLSVAPTALSADRRGAYCLDQLVTFAPIGGQATLGEFAEIVPHLDVLIIEDAQLMRADRFDQLATVLRRYGKQPGTPFGGIQIVLLGDLHAAVPAVDYADVEQFHAHYRGPQVCFANAYRRANIAALQLTNRLGKDDGEVAQIRHQLATGHRTHHALARLHQHVEACYHGPLGLPSAQILPTANAAARQRANQLEWCAETTQVIHARVVGEATGYCPPVPRELHFSEDLSVMMVAADPAGRWQAGDTALVVDVAYAGAHGRHYRPVVTLAFTHGEPVQVRDHCWVVHRPRIGKRGITHVEVGRYYQLPFVLAEGLSAHAARGIRGENLFFHREGAPEYPGQITGMLTDQRNLSAIVLTRAITWPEARAERDIGWLIARLTGGGERRCAIELRTARTAGRSFPIEVALAFADGETITSIIAPPADLTLPRTVAGISAARLQLAPTFAHVWAMVEQEASDWQLVSTNGDATLQCLNAAPADELGRLPVAIASIPSAATDGGGERDIGDVAARARASLAAAERAAVRGAPYRAGNHARSGYTLSRDGLITPYGVPKLVSQLLSNRIRGQKPSDETDRSLLAFEATYQVRVQRRLMVDFPPLHQVLRNGVHVCFYLPDFDLRHGLLVGDLARIAREHGLLATTGEPTAQSEVLIADDAHLALRDAKTRYHWYQPVYSIAEFLQWVRTLRSQPVHQLRTAEPGTAPSVSADAEVISLTAPSDARPERRW